MSLDFISAAIKELRLGQKDQDCCQPLQFYHSDDRILCRDEICFFMARYQTGICQFEVFKVIDS